MIPIKVLDEVSPLEAVVLGTAESFGGPPELDEAYDPKTIQHIKAGTFPQEQDLIPEMEAFASVLQKYDVKVYRPELMENYNQIFSRDIGMVIDDKFLVPRILKNRKEEIKGIQYILDQIDANKLVRVDTEARFEGGDIMPWNGKIFAGYSKKEDFDTYVVSRTNEAGIEFLIAEFPDWEVHAFELKKSDEDPYENALHLDCCF
jgi:N-dimethylarginine dimethylaminohydrolase